MISRRISRSVSRQLLKKDDVDRSQAIRQLFEDFAGD